MRYLCFDIGDKRTGVASGDDEMSLTGPVDVLEIPVSPALIDAMCEMVKEHGPGAIVIGLPLNMDGTRGKQAKKVEALARELGERVSLPIHLGDERLTSYAADQAMSRSGLTHKQKKARRDALAAAAILRDFFAAADAREEDENGGAAPTDGSPL